MTAITAGTIVAVFLIAVLVTVLAGWLKDELEKPDPYEDEDGER